MARSQPSLFLSYTSEDAFWMNYTSTTYGTTFKSISAEAALLKFSSYVTDSNGDVRIIIFDSNDSIFPTQVNLATTLAGVYDALPVASSDLATIQGIFGSKIDVLYDLRGMFSDKVTAYNWLWNTVQSNVTKSFFVISPSGRYQSVDYYVEFRAFVFEMNSSEPGSQKLVSSILGAYPPLTPVLGFFGLGGENSTISALSQSELVDVPTDLVSDLSFYSGFPSITSVTQTSSFRTLTYNPKKIYIMFSYSQGDALFFDLSANLDIWNSIDNSTNQPYRAEIPEAWQMSPLLADIAPPVMNYYYQTMTPYDSFMTGASGVGYVHPGQLPNLTSYLSLSNSFDSIADLHIPFLVWGDTSTATTSIYKAFAAYPGTQAIMGKEPGLEWEMVGNTPVMIVNFHAPKSKTFTSSDVSSAVASIQSLAQSTHFIFVFMDAQNPGYAYIQQVLQGLGSKYVPVRADEFACMYDQSQGIGCTSDPPGPPAQSTTFGLFLTFAGAVAVGLVCVPRVVKAPRLSRRATA